MRSHGNFLDQFDGTRALQGEEKVRSKINLNIAQVSV